MDTLTLMAQEPELKSAKKEGIKRGSAQVRIHKSEPGRTQHSDDVRPARCGP